jgi:predicted amidohydrolase
MKIHLVQMCPELNNKENNLKKILDYIDEGLKRNANLIIFGECALVGYDLVKGKMLELSETIPGPTTMEVAAKLKGSNCYVVFGMPECDSGLVYNSAPLIGPEGVIGVARKLYLANFKSDLTGQVFAEDVHFKPGKRISVFNTKFGKIGIQICLDFYHPEIAQAQALAGAWLIIHPSATPLLLNDIKLPAIWDARPWENLVCWCYVNLVGEQAGQKFNGGTGVYFGDQGLKKQASIGKHAIEEVLDFEVESELIYDMRMKRTNIKDIRPELIRQLLTIAEKT